MKSSQWTTAWMAACMIAMFCISCSAADPMDVVEGEDGVADPAADADAPNTDLTPHIPGLVKLGNVRVYTIEKRVEFDAMIALTPGVLIEVLACHPRGKVHETVMTANVQPSFVHAGLELIGLKRGTPVSYGDGKKPPTGPPVRISVRWDVDGETKRVRAEDLLYDVKNEKPMEHQDWVFCGSVENPDGEISYVADITGNIITTYNDPTTVIDNPSKGGDDDELLEINGKVCPEPGTLVTLILEPGGEDAEEKDADETPQETPDEAPY